MEEGRENEILARSLRKAVMTVWQRRLSGEVFDKLTQRFEEGLEVEASDVMPADELLAQFSTKGGPPIESLIAVDRLLDRLDLLGESPAAVASGVEMCLEGLHLNRRVNKSERSVPGTYRFEA